MEEKFIVYDVLDERLAKKNWELIKRWFDNNPDRTTCTTTLGIIHKHKMKEDFIKFCMPGIILED